MTTKKDRPQKRGAKGYYTGSRLAFLESRLDEYISLRGKSRHHFWYELYEAWWEKFPWRLPDKEEPPTDDNAKMKQLAYLGVDDANEKAKVEAQTHERVSSWFSYRASVQNSHRVGGAWTPILKHLHNQLNPKPRCRSVVQQFMHEEPMVVNAAFVSKYGDGRALECVDRLNKWNQVAKQLVTGTYKDRVPKLEQRAKEDHERELKEWSLELDQIQEAEDVGLARDSLFAAVHPLLTLVGRYSGCYVTLLAAAPEPAGDQPYFSALHYYPQETSKRVNWTEFDEQGFKDGVARPFVKYIQWMEDPKGGQGEAVVPAPSKTAVTAASTSRPSTTIQTIDPTPQPGRYKKRPLVYTENSSEDEDVDMALDPDGDFGSNSNRAPAKRLRLSPIVTRSSRSTSTSEATITESSTLCSPHSSTINHSPSPDDPEAETEIPGTNSNVLPPSTHTNMHEDTPVGTAPAPCGSPAVDTDLNDSDDPSTNNGALRDRMSTMSSGIHHTGKPTPTPPSPSPVPDPGPELEIPKFLMERNIYGYLSSVEEPAFRDLLNNYLRFELADNSRIRGALSTTHRPAVVAWWRSRARPSRTPPFNDFESLTKDIIQWWVTLQPRWRKIKPGKTVRNEGDWEDLYQPGLNGLLNVVILAHWWAKILKNRGLAVNETYSWFVSDVSWVLSQLTSAAHEGIFDD